MSSVKENLLSEINDDYRCDLFQEIATARGENAAKFEKKYKVKPLDCYVVELSDGYHCYDKKQVQQVLKKWHSSNATHTGYKINETYPMPFKELLE